MRVNALIVLASIGIITLSAGLALSIDIFGEENIQVESDNLKNLLRLIPQTTIGNYATEDGVLFIDNSLNANTAIRIFTTKGSDQSGSLIQTHVTNPDFRRPIIHLISEGSSGANVDIRVDSPNPDIEFIETDQLSPEGKFEISVNEDLLRISGRNKQDTSFETGYIFERVADGGSLGIGINGNPLAKLHIALDTGSETENALLLDNTRGISAAQLGLAWRNAVGQFYPARISSKVGNGYSNSELIIEVSDSNRQLQNRLTIDKNGDVSIMSLSGSENAFVCVDSAGKLFRSDVICA
jgi:hypothetical protein